MAMIVQHKPGPNHVQPAPPINGKTSELWFDPRTGKLRLPTSKGQWGALQVSPRIDILAPTSGPSYAATTLALVLSGTITLGDAAISTVECFVEHAGVVQTFPVIVDGVTWSADLTMEVGVSIVIVRVYDADGFFGTDVMSVSLGDNADPEIILNTPVADTIASQEIAFTGTVSDDLAVKNVTYAVSGATTLNGTCTLTNGTDWTTGDLAFALGTSTITVTVTDMADKTATVQKTVLVDIEAPVCTIINPTTEVSLATNQDSFTISGTATDDLEVAEVTYALSGATVATGSAVGTNNWTFNVILEEGSTQIAVTAMDSAGRTHTDYLTIAYAAVTALTNIDIPANVNNVELRQLALDNGWDGTTLSSVTVTVKTGVRVGSTSTSTPAMITGDLTNMNMTLVVESGAYIVGAGGAGANLGVNGGNGGPALFATSPLTVENYGIIGGGGGGGASGESVALGATGNALMLDSPRGQYLQRYNVASGSTVKGTFSTFIKRGKLGTPQAIWTCEGPSSGTTMLFFDSTNHLHYDDNYPGQAARGIISVNTFTDVSKIHHIVLALDHTAATESDRIVLTVDGVRQSVTSASYPLQNQAASRFLAGYPQRLGYSAYYPATAGYLDGIISNTVIIDGYALPWHAFAKIVDGVPVPKALEHPSDRVNTAETFVPVMASASQAGFVVSAGTVLNAFYPWHAFDGTQSYWQPVNPIALPNHLQIDFPSARVVGGCTFKAFNDSRYQASGMFQGWDGSQWIDLVPFTGLYMDTTFTWGDRTPISKFRMYITATSDVDTFHCTQILLHEVLPLVDTDYNLLPLMSNVDQVGWHLATSNHNPGSGPAYGLAMRSDRSYWFTYNLGTAACDQWYEVTPPTPLMVGAMTAWWGSSSASYYSIEDMAIEGWDGSQWIVLWSGTDLGFGGTHTLYFANPGVYAKYRIHVTKTGRPYTINGTYYFAVAANLRLHPVTTSENAEDAADGKIPTAGKTNIITNSMTAGGTLAGGTNGIYPGYYTGNEWAWNSGALYNAGGVDFGAPGPVVKKALVYPSSAGGFNNDSAGWAQPLRFELQVSTDNLGWSAIATTDYTQPGAYGAPCLAVQLLAPANVTRYRFVRVKVSRVNGGSIWLHISELQLFGYDANADDVGTNGVMLNYDNTGAFGEDSSAKGNTWQTFGSIVASNQLKDTALSNYCVLSQTDKGPSAIISKGDLRITCPAVHNGVRGTLPLPATGKYYFEATVLSTTGTNSAIEVGVITSNGVMTEPQYAGQYGVYASNSGQITADGVTTGGLGIFYAGDVLKIALDCDNGKMWVGKNEGWWDSSAGLTGSPADGLNPTIIVALVGKFPYAHAYANSLDLNFGQKTFAHNPPAGFQPRVTLHASDVIDAICGGVGGGGAGLIVGPAGVHSNLPGFSSNVAGGAAQSGSLTSGGTGATPGTTGSVSGGAGGAGGGLGSAGAAAQQGTDGYVTALASATPGNPGPYLVGATNVDLTNVGSLLGPVS